MTHKKECITLVEILAGQGHDIGIDSNGSGLRIENKTGSRSISPRLAPKEMVVWLNGYVNGIEEVQRATSLKMREAVPLPNYRDEIRKEAGRG